MDSLRKRDLLSNLPVCLLISIISILPFKDSVKTSVLSKRWLNLYRETTNIVFKESEFVNLNVSDEETKNVERALFVRIIREWISRFIGESLESFELYFSKPVDFVADITSLVDFVASKQVKNLVLDFSSPVSREVGVYEHLITLLRYQKNQFDISRLVFNLLYVKNLTICSFFLQMIQDCDDPMELHDPMKTRHLVMKTNLHTNEFMGITIFLNCCPELESLTFDMVTNELILRKSMPLNPKKYWRNNKSYECLEKTLKVVKVKNFRGGSNELHVLRYLIRNGRVMEHLNLYEATGLDHDQRRLVMVGGEKVRKFLKRASSSQLRISLYNA